MLPNVERKCARNARQNMPLPTPITPRLPNNTCTQLKNVPEPLVVDVIAIQQAFQRSAAIRGLGEVFQRRQCAFSGAHLVCLVAWLRREEFGAVFSAREACDYASVVLRDVEVRLPSPRVLTQRF